MFRKYTLAGALLVVFAISRGSLSADEAPADWTFKSAKANEAIRKYQVACKKLDDGYAQQRAENRAALIEKLQEEVKAATKNNDLDDALAIRDLIKVIQKIPNTEQPAKDGDGPKKLATIPAKARKFKGHHYLVSQTFLDLAAAKQTCEKASGYLVRIESAEEQAFVRTLLAGRGPAFGRSSQEDPYIDGTDEKEHGVWLFSNGKAMAYKNWEASQNEPRPGRHAIGINTARGYAWSTVPPTEQRLFICEWDQ